MTDWSKYWWESITGPKNLTLSVAKVLREKGNAYLFVPDDLPWRSQMRATVEYELRQSPEMEDFDVDFIDVADECESIIDIGRFLLDKYAQPNVASGYRHREKIQQYIVQNHVLENRVLWIKGMDSDQSKMWTAFCKDYYPATERDGRFVLECHTEYKDNERKNLGTINYGNIINNFDLSLFTSTYINQSENRYSTIWEQYAATLVSVLCGTDAEISEALMKNWDFRYEESADVLIRIAEDFQFSKRGLENSNHILSLVRTNDTSGINILVWKAQLQIIFPLLEIERLSFVKQYADQIQLALHESYYDYQSNHGKRIKQFGEYIDKPEDAELGTLYRLTKLRKETDVSQYLLFIPHEGDRSRLDLLHDLRNNLAHGIPCETSQISSFIDTFPYQWK